MGDIFVLPEGCLANVLSFTGPKDACRLSLVSSTFKSAADWDTVWERFLPPDYQSLISRSLDPSLLTCSPSKKQLFLRLCQNPILIDAGKKSFSLDKWSGKKCYMLSARDLSIVWGDTPRYWRWTADPESRFAEVAELITVCWLEICSKINTSMLSPSTLYTAYFVFKTTNVAYGFDHRPVDVSVGLVGSESSKREVYLDDVRGHAQRQHFPILSLRGGFFNRAYNRFVGSAPIREIDDTASDARSTLEKDGQYPKKRGDGWLEVELGEFFNKEGEYGELEISVLEVEAGDWKGGLIVQGIELRPKEAN